MPEELHKLKEQLAHCQGLVQQLQQENKELKRASIAHSEFLSNVSHELLTPLTSIQAYCELLLMFGNEDPATSEEFLQNIDHECQRLNQLVNGILEAAKLEESKMEWNIQQGDLLATIQRAIKAMEKMREEKQLDLQTELPDALPVVSFDQERVLQVLTQLLNNAIKFTEEGKVALCAQLTDEHIHVSISDTGCGIAPEHHARIFEKFCQLGDQLTSKPTGTGLGLYISQEIIHKHGGKIWVESQPDVGSTFHFTLPYDRQ